MWSWEFLTNVLKIDKDRLYITIFAGDKSDNLEEDIESRNIWSSIISNDRIIACSKSYNFWEMGNIGPCGPCSEIHIDLRDINERKKIDGKKLINKDHPEVIELWNLVFMQYNRKDSGVLENLSKKHVDTGMGFERLCMVLQEKKSTYDTDIFSDLINEISKKSGFIYGKEEEKDIAIRVVVDHIRAVSFAIADGQLPSNVGAGYVIRRILRRAVRYGFSFLNFESPFLCHLVEIVFNKFSSVFPEISTQIKYVSNIINEKKKPFFKTLEKGTSLIQEIIKKSNSNIIDSKKVFELYDTYGFPKDLTAVIFKEHGKSFSEKDYKMYLNEQKQRSKSVANFSSKEWIVLSKEDQKGFLGYQDPLLYESLVKILMYREVNIKNKKFYHLVFNQTPFYPEGGGQVGDQGSLILDNSEISIINTKKENNLILHLVESLPKNLDKEYLVKININKRKLNSRNHTATHLLHSELISLLGSHVEQKGSLVDYNHLRFDFSHFEKINEDKIKIIENNINQKILSGIKLEEMLNVSLDYAKSIGAMALFGEKYDESVRVIKYGESVELCGGTHVQNTNEIGLFKIISESSVASGVRRIEAITSINAISYFESIAKDFNLVKQIVKNYQNPIKAVENLILENKKLKDKVDFLESRESDLIQEKLLKSIVKIKEINVLIFSSEISPKMLKKISFNLLNKTSNLFLALFSTDEDKVIFNLGISKDLIELKNWNANDLIKEFSKDLEGSGGGQDFFATASGKKINKVPDVIKKINSFLLEN